MTNTHEQAVAFARRQSNRGPQFGEGLCLQRVHICYDIPAKYPSAASAWEHATMQHRETNPAKIPGDAPFVFWIGGSHGFGHIAIPTTTGRCLSTDIHRRGYFDEIPVAEIQQRWGLRLVGWTRDLNGIAVPDPTPPPPPARKAVETPYDHFYGSLGDLLNEYGPKIQKKYVARRRLVDGVAALRKAAPAPTSQKGPKK